MSKFITALRSGRVLLMDGAMGTELQRWIRAPSFEGFEEFNLTHPGLVRAIQHIYLHATAEVLLTNTFQANPAALASQNLADRHHAIWEAALRIAREAGPEPHFVLADVGPVEKLNYANATAIILECQYADGILLQTWSSLDALKQFVDARGDVCGPAPPLLVSFTYHRDNPSHELTTFTGARPEECARAAVDAGAAAVGANCGKDIRMQDMAELVKRYRTVCDLPLFVRPNAGTPTLTEAGWQYPHSPQAMAAALPPLLEGGIAMVGGCCGTTPEHLRFFRKEIDAWLRMKGNR
jgi:5-methyltetrahydrofolate--homocysteine methyltransferase